MGALSPWHIILIAIVALLLFGPNKLPELGRGFGKMFREFKDATNGNGNNSSTDDQPTIARKEINPEVSKSESGQVNK
ncbi:twin-arginine translocase TatA/TatE family subunit [Paenibacillus qinlingensis]|uniref:Sec-independent protein translocase protein TatA n=1 Tax=Paenibacillus qinlingensis TaxID=1837343 RepID=A0ABU1NN90_9BACL|nr:twin-arginine translocase TatA/TatE family subunit [Paenibacillus qinlingensis]MDR6548907.1 sec-independent protein translocase protein TatA [Paenibacillus qinlingensis]